MSRPVWLVTIPRLRWPDMILRKYYYRGWWESDDTANGGDEDRTKLVKVSMSLKYSRRRRRIRRRRRTSTRVSLWIPQSSRKVLRDIPGSLPVILSSDTTVLGKLDLVPQLQPPATTATQHNEKLICNYQKQIDN